MPKPLAATHFELLVPFAVNDERSHVLISRPHSLNLLIRIVGRFNIFCKNVDKSGRREGNIVD